jgi:hypothetical protein
MAPFIFARCPGGQCGKPAIRGPTFDEVPAIPAGKEEPAIHGWTPQ